MSRLAATQSRVATGGKDDWRTPRALLEAVQRRLHLWLRLDAASDAKNVIPMAFGSYDETSDALRRDWADALASICEDNPCLTPWGAAVWLNPPYSRNDDFIAKAAVECANGARVVCLVPVRTDTRWWAEHVHRDDGETRAARVLLLKGRLKFEHPGVEKATGAPFPSAIVYYDPSHRGAPQYEVWDWRRDVPAAANDNERR